MVPKLRKANSKLQKWHADFKNLPHIPVFVMAFTLWTKISKIYIAWHSHKCLCHFSRLWTTLEWVNGRRRCLPTRGDRRRWRHLRTAAAVAWLSSTPAPSSSTSTPGWTAGVPSQALSSSTSESPHIIRHWGNLFILFIRSGFFWQATIYCYVGVQYINTCIWAKWIVP